MDQNHSCNTILYDIYTFSRFLAPTIYIWLRRYRVSNVRAFGARTTRCRQRSSLHYLLMRISRYDITATGYRIKIYNIISIWIFLNEDFWFTISECVKLQVPLLVIWFRGFLNENLRIRSCEWGFLDENIWMRICVQRRDDYFCMSITKWGFLIVDLWMITTSGRCLNYIFWIRSWIRIWMMTSSIRIYIYLCW